MVSWVSRFISGHRNQKDASYMNLYTVACKPYLWTKGACYVKVSAKHHSYLLRNQQKVWQYFYKIDKSTHIKRDNSRH